MLTRFANPARFMRVSGAALRWAGVAAALVLAVFVGLDPEGIPVLMLGLLLGTPALSLLGAIAAALTLGARRPGVLVSLVVLPLYLPPLIFGSGAVEASLSGDGARAHLLLLGAVTLAALPLAPLATAAALRQALD